MAGYLIEDLADFDAFAGDPNYWESGVYTTLACDPNLAGRTYTTAVIAPDTDNTGNEFEGTVFTGVFDGNDHSIMNLTIVTVGPDNWYLGLFEYIGEDGQVRNLGIDGGFVSGGNVYVGGLMESNRGIVLNCFWDIIENQTYPYLRVYLAGDINKDGTTNFGDLYIVAGEWMRQD